MEKYILIAVCLITMTGCATSTKTTPHTASAPSADANTLGEPGFDVLEFDILDQEFSNRNLTITDPIEPWNRLMFGANDRLYFWILKPAALGYKAIMPEPGRVGIRNFFHNVSTPVRFTNCLLQGKFHSAGNEVNRLVINTTWGVLGIWDPALDHGKLEPATEDTGQTLAVWGLDNGCYIVWPFFGPSTLRDSAGAAGDYVLDPVFYVEDDEAVIVVSSVKVANKTSFHIGEYESFKEASVDPYIALRNAYIQYRNNQIKE